MVPKGWEEAEWGVTANWRDVSFWSDEKVMELDHCDSYTTL